MTLYNKHIRFFLILVLFTLTVAGIRLHWIKKAVPSKAIVLYINKTRFTRPAQFYPVVSYQTKSGEVVARGTYNLPISTGDTVDILYNPDDVTDFRLNTTYWLWFDVWSWYRMIWIAIAMYYLVLFIVNRSLKHKAVKLVDRERENEVTTSTHEPGTKLVVSDIVAVRRNRLQVKTKRLPRVVKAILILLVPVGVFLIGHIWDLPYARQIAVVIFLAITTIGSPSGPAPNRDK